MHRSIQVSVLVFLALIFSLGGCCSNLTVQHPPLSGPQIARQADDNTVALVADFAPRQPPFCTGVWVAKDTILTANHCVMGYVEGQHRYLVTKYLVEHGIPAPFAAMFAGAEPDDDDDGQVAVLLREANVLFPKLNPMTVNIPYVVHSEANEEGTAPTTLHHCSAVSLYSDLDLAVLRVSGWIPPHLSARLASQSPLVGEDVFLVGNSAGSWFSYKRLVVSAYRQNMRPAGVNKQGPFLQAVGAVIPGDSGGGLFNDRGELVGIASFLSTRTGYGYFVHVQNIRSVLIGQHLLPADLSVQKDPDEDATLPSDQ